MHHVKQVQYIDTQQDHNLLTYYFHIHATSDISTFGYINAN